MSAAETYEACRTKRRSTKLEMADRLNAIGEIVQRIEPCSMRQAFYQAEIAGIVESTRPTEKTDSRAKQWKGNSVELDAIDPDTLREIVRDAIERHIGPGRLARGREVRTGLRGKMDQTRTWLPDIPGACVMSASRSMRGKRTFRTQTSTNTAGDAP
jgi:hypothetical protein